MNVIVFLAGLATVWLLLTTITVTLLVAEGQRERHSDAVVPPDEFDCPAFGPLDDIEPRFAEPADDEDRSVLGFVTDCEGDDATDGLAESAHGDHERETDPPKAR